MKTALIIPAAGSGKRFGGTLPKQFVEVLGVPVLVHTLRVFQAHTAIDDIIVVAAPDFRQDLADLTQRYGISKVREIVAGGSERQESIYNALGSPTARAADIILVHDAVRPCIRPDFVQAVLQAAGRYGAVVPGLVPRETIKQVGPDGTVIATPPRADLRSIQTPQAFRREIVMRAYEQARSDGFLGTDDASLVERSGFPVRVIEGQEGNIKITTQSDLSAAERFLRTQAANQPEGGNDDQLDAQHT